MVENLIITNKIFRLNLALVIYYLNNLYVMYFYSHLFYLYCQFVFAVAPLIYNFKGVSIVSLDDTSVARWQPLKIFQKRYLKKIIRHHDLFANNWSNGMYRDRKVINSNNLFNTLLHWENIIKIFPNTVEQVLITGI